jgi:hypothetical protein
VSDPSDQLLREIDEDLKREQWQKLWKAYGRYAVGAVVVVVVIVLGFVGWREYHTQELADDGLTYWKADRQAAFGDYRAAAEGFESLVQSGSGGYPELAGLREAAALAQAGDRESALELYDRIAAEAGSGSALGELAKLYAAMLLVDTGDPRQVEERLAPLAQEGAPWRFSARELQGLLALRTGDLEKARTIFDALANDPDTPTTLRNRAAELLAVTGGGA